MLLKKEAFQLPFAGQQLYELSQQAYPHGSPWQATQFLVDINLENSYYLVLTCDQTWVGYVSCQFVLDEAEVTNLAVLPDYRGQRIAQKLVSALLTQLAAQGIQQLFLEVRASNLAAQKLYAKNGFTQIGVRKNYYHRPTEDAYLMGLSLKEVKQTHDE